MKPGTLLRIKKQSRHNITIRNNGEFALLAPSDGKYIQYDALFPSGVRVIYMPINWEVISGSE
jgi:hypothetical protein